MIITPKSKRFILVQLYVMNWNGNQHKKFNYFYLHTILKTINFVSESKKTDIYTYKSTPHAQNLPFKNKKWTSKIIRSPPPIRIYLVLVDPPPPQDGHIYLWPLIGWNNNQEQKEARTIRMMSGRNIFSWCAQLHPQLNIWKALKKLPVLSLQGKIFLKICPDIAHRCPFNLPKYSTAVHDKYSQM